ncbi:MAG TPA: hypothetical protein PLH15_08775, partial [Spirochaetota bacterium]|nr:hypothetical protein [Spirochaetota bacterium]
FLSSISFGHSKRNGQTDFKGVKHLLGQPASRASLIFCMIHADNEYIRRSLIESAQNLGNMDLKGAPHLYQQVRCPDKP